MKTKNKYFKPVNSTQTYVCVMGDVTVSATNHRQTAANTPQRTVCPQSVCVFVSQYFSVIERGTTENALISEPVHAVKTTEQSWIE